MGLSVEGDQNNIVMRSWRTRVGTIVLLGCVLWWTVPVLSQRGEEDHHSVHETSNPEHVPHVVVSPGTMDWDGSAEGIAYSEFNHHLAGFLVVLMGLAELTQAGRLPSLEWVKVLLPVSMLIAALFLLIWSDHDAWPIGPLSFYQTYFGENHVMVQHKTFGVLLLAVGIVELLRRFRRLTHFAWTVPLPLLATIGGVILFGHSHGAHPSTQKIEIHHATVGTLAIAAGSAKFLSSWFGSASTAPRVTWEWIWAGLVLALGIQLLWYSE
jgi:hypothetical protein